VHNSSGVELSPLDFLPDDTLANPLCIVVPFVLPTLGDHNSMFDINDWISSTERSGHFFSPVASKCSIDTTKFLQELSNEEKQAILDESNRLWKINFYGLETAVDVGLARAVVDQYVTRVIDSVANA
jgi:hypothetical protein